MREQEDDTVYMRTKWRCSACGNVNSMEFDNVCRRCMDRALELDAGKLSSLSSPEGK
jgi:Zn finger protein HypA/HybF involved in hydrogenase expression